uniref:Uncharacterized protein n=1 Tax=Timema cristinae TaxID=61476 RepID=A0A7R9CR04_TIMCR|nr:unnamed protein product [Timema cristinae]
MPDLELARSGNARFAPNMGLSGPDMNQFWPDIFPHRECEVLKELSMKPRKINIILKIMDQDQLTMNETKIRGLGSDKRFSLRGNHNLFVQWQQCKPTGEYDFGGVIGVYSTPEYNKEQLVIRGPTTINLVICYAWYSGIKNPGIKYSYYIPASKSFVPKYSWELLDWSECSVLCGGGTQEAVPSCVEEHGGKVSDQYCQNMSKPETRSRVCNKDPCPTKWRVDVWGQCCISDTGIGMQNRAVKCVQEPQKAGEDDVIVENKLCKEKKPLKSQKCSNPTKCRKSRQTPRFKSPAHLISNLMQVKDLYDAADSNEQKPFVSEHKNARNINEHRLLSYWKLSALENKEKDNYGPMDPEKEEDLADWEQEQSDYDQQDYEGEEPGPATNNEFVEYETDENHDYVGPARPEDHMDEGLDDNYSEVHYDNFSPSFWEKLPSPHSPYRQGNPDKSSTNPQHSYFTVEVKGTENTAKQVKRESEQRRSLAQTPFETEDESLSVDDEYTQSQPDQPTLTFRDKYISNGHLFPSMLSQAHELRGNMYDAGEVSSLHPHTFERGDNVIQLLSPDEQYWVDRNVRGTKNKPLRNRLDSKRQKNVLSIPHKHYWDIRNSRTVKRANERTRYGSGRYRKTKEPIVSIDENPPPIVEVIPLIKNPEVLDLSDEAKEQLGDKVLGVAEKLIPDTQNAKNVTGYEARLKLEGNLTK